MRTSRRGVFVAVVAALLIAVAALPSPGRASPSSFVVMFSDGDWVGGGAQRVFTPRTGTITLRGTAGYLTVGVSGGTLGDSYTMDFAAPAGKKLRPGVYIGAQRAPFREAGRPGIDIGGDGRGCNTITGLFEVRDIRINRKGAVTRLWLLYEQHCEGGRSALYGEIRVGEPASPDPLLVAPTTVRWPASDLGRPSTVVPVTLMALDSPVRLTRVSIAGSNPADFAIRSDECTGRTLPVGGSCQIWMRYVPTVAGTRVAVLRATDASGRRRDVALQGFAYGGRTRVVMTSDPGDYIGGGRNWSYTWANGRIGAVGSRQYLGFGVVGADGSDWSADFVPAAGDIIAPGRYANATRYPFNGSGPGLAVGGNGRGCNTLTGEFTVNSLAWWPDGTLHAASVSFVQHCEGGTPALRGTFEFRAGDATPPAPWMTAQSFPSRRRGSRCVVPRVVGKPLRKARRLLGRAHCGVGRIRRVSSVRMRRGLVLRQTPRAGAKRKRGTRVRLVVSRGRR